MPYLIPFGLVFSAVVASFAPVPRTVGLCLLIAGYGAAFATGLLSSPSLLAVLLLLLAAYAVAPQRQRYLRYAGHALFLTVAVALAMHWMPGFHNLRAIGPERLTPDALPFTMYLNLDKPLGGFWLLLVLPWVMPRYELRQLWIGIAGAALATMLCLPVAVALDVVAWAPKWPAATWVWALNNLVLVTAMEEVLFRGYVQGGLSRSLKTWPHGEMIALCVASVLFGLAHFSGGWQWILLASLAGLAYGWTYRVAGLPAAVLAHFGLNATHFLLFTYPMLQAPS
jgi:membrane protease YdiL (CAAX protease family)